jgi:hypothetical protein
MNPIFIPLIAFGIAMVALTSVVVVRRDRKARAEKRLENIILELDNGSVESATAALWIVLRHSKADWI